MYFCILAPPLSRLHLVVSLCIVKAESPKFVVHFIRENGVSQINKENRPGTGEVPRWTSAKFLWGLSLGIKDTCLAIRAESERK